MRLKHKPSFGEKVHSTFRVGRSSLVRIAYGAGILLSVLSVLFTIRDIVLRLTGQEDVPKEGLMLASGLLFLFLGLFVFQSIRAILNARSVAYRASLKYLHAYHHSMRDLSCAIKVAHEKIVDQKTSNLSSCFDAHFNGAVEKVRNDPNARPRKMSIRVREDAKSNTKVDLSGEIDVCLILFYDALDHMRAAFELITGAPIQVCIKSLSQSEDDPSRPIARTYLRDRLSEQTLMVVDEVIHETDLDGIKTNDHYKVLSSAENNIWCIRCGKNSEMLKRYETMTVRAAFSECGIVFPNESFLLGAISRRPFGASYASRRKSYWHRMAAKKPEPVPFDSLPDINGLLLVSSPKKQAFHRVDEQLIHQFSDSLYSTLEDMSYIMKHNLNGAPEVA